MFTPSHYLVRVQNLTLAVADFRAAGFRVVWGGNPEHAHNALIHFTEGGFIELFNPQAAGGKGTAQLAAMKVGAQIRLPLFVRMNRWFAGRGFCDFALETEMDLSEAVDEIKSLGAQLGKTRDFSRKREDGVTTHWQLCWPKSAELPFLMGPYDPPPVLDNQDLEHDNGIRAIHGLRLTNPNPLAYGKNLQRLLGDADLQVADDLVRVISDKFVFLLTKGSEHLCESLLVDQVPPAMRESHSLKLEYAPINKG